MAPVSLEPRILALDRRARSWVHVAVTLTTLAAALLIAQAWLLSETVSRVFRSHQRLAAVTPLLGLLLILIAARAGLLWTGEVAAQRGASRIKGNLRARLMRHLFALGPSQERDERSGELAHTMVEGIEALDEYVTQYQTARLLAALVPAMVLLVVLLLDPWSALVLVFAGPMLVLLLAVIGSRTKELSERRFQELSWMSAHFLDMVQGLTTLKLFGRSKDQAETIEEISRHFGKTTMQVLRTAFQTSLVLEWASVGATAFVALQVSLRLMNGLLPFDRALFILLLTPEFFVPLRQLALKYHSGTAGKAAAQRIFALLDTPLPRPIAAPRPAMVLPSQRAIVAPECCGLRFADVRFAYDGGRRPALRGLTLTVPDGQTVALVGASGAGKTTVARLVLRFIEPSAGAILIGGAPLSALDPAAWRSRVGWVSQHPHLFYGTVADNIRLARPGADDAAVEAAARAANALAFIQALPQGFATPINEAGTRLSGGQRQRLAIARAFLKDAPLLLLDEPTSHLDAESERLIQEALARLMRGRTTLMIAHRLEMAYGAQQIVVLEQGRAVECGSHQALLAASGRYQALVAAYEAETVEAVR
jgi:ATP-binding cassette subfamily C protein CydD